MAIGRFIWRMTGIGHSVDTIKNIIEEGSVKAGFERTLYEDTFEDNPISSGFYKMGKYDGNKEGYNRASKEYESKLLEQAELFLKQKKDFQKERDAYEALLNEYELAITELEEKTCRTERENQLLQSLLLKERQLKKLAV